MPDGMHEGPIFPFFGIVGPCRQCLGIPIHLKVAINNNGNAWILHGMASTGSYRIRLANHPLSGSSMSTNDAVTVWLGQLQAGELAAVRPLWEKCFQRLVGLARKRLLDAPRHAADEEDVALSAFNSFWIKAQAGQFPDLTDRDSLWRLLATFTLRKAAHHVRDAGRLKRGGGVARDDSEVLEELLASEPDPALAAEVAEECDRLVGALQVPELRQVALLRMDGFSVDEVAARIGCDPRSVKRKLRLIRGIWKREAGDE
jgi:DNA-directed RNA polymerase specialized sigma24 family protein